MDIKEEKISEKKLEVTAEKPPDIKLQLSAEEMKKKQAKKDEDPRITRFKNTEVTFMQIPEHQV